jgi:hypothetical protein
MGETSTFDGRRLAFAMTREPGSLRAAVCLGFFEQRLLAAECLRRLRSAAQAAREDRVA